MVGGKGEGKEKLREAGDEEVGWNKLNEKSQEKETWPFSWAPHTSYH